MFCSPPILSHPAAVSSSRYSIQVIELSCQGALAAGPSVRLRLIWEYEADLLAANMLLQDMVAPEAVKAFEGLYDTDDVARRT